MTVQIRTTHVGSLPRTDELLRANAAHAEGALDDDGLAAVVRAQTDAVVARQTDIGLSIVNDGEYGHAMTEKVDYGAWWFYTFERFGGLEVIDPERAAAARRHLADMDEEVLATILHPSSRRRLDALAAGGVGTVVVDECHHLRAHWAVVVHYLLRRLRGGGVDPTLIGLTATLPCREDPAWSRYHDLLGEVDHEVPVPAVIQEGHLAPYRSLLHLTLPAEEETRFLATAGAELRTRLRLHLLSADGVAYLTRVVAP